MLNAQDLINLLQADRKLRTATLFISNNEVIRVSRNHVFKARASRYSFTVSHGKPNYEARQVILKAKRNKEVIQPCHVVTREWPAKKKAAKKASK